MASTQDQVILKFPPSPAHFHYPHEKPKLLDDGNWSKLASIPFGKNRFEQFQAFYVESTGSDHVSCLVPGCKNVKYKAFGNNFGQSVASHLLHRHPELLTPDEQKKNLKRNTEPEPEKSKTNSKQKSVKEVPSSMRSFIQQGVSSDS